MIKFILGLLFAIFLIGLGIWQTVQVIKEFKEKKDKNK